MEFNVKNIMEMNSYQVLNNAKKSSISDTQNLDARESHLNEQIPQHRNENQQIYMRNRFCSERLKNNETDLSILLNRHVKHSSSSKNKNVVLSN